MGTLKRGEAIRDEVWFSKIETHNEYDKCQITLYWTDLEGRYYEREYLR